MKRDKVVFVDDEVLNLKALKRVFRNEPFDFITYDSPTEALTKIGAIRPKVVISDQCMPEMNGIAFLREVKNRRPDAACIILTGHADLDSAMEAINQGRVFRYIRKPWDNDQLKADVRCALEYQESIAWLRNVTDLLAEEILRARQDSKALHKFALSAFRGLDQPLMVISGYIKLLEAYITDEVPNLYYSNIRLELQQIEALKNRIQSFSKHVALRRLQNQ